MFCHPRLADELTNRTLLLLLSHGGRLLPWALPARLTQPGRLQTAFSLLPHLSWHPPVGMACVTPRHRELLSPKSESIHETWATPSSVNLCRLLRPCGPYSCAQTAHAICSATSIRSSARTFSIWLTMVATDDPAKSRATATLSNVVTSEPESPPAEMLVVTI